MTARNDDTVAVRVTVEVVVDRQRWLLQTGGFPPVPPPGFPEGAEWPPREMVEQQRAELAALDVHADIAEYVSVQLPCADHLDESGASVHLVGFERVAATYPGRPLH